MSPDRVTESVLNIVLVEDNDDDVALLERHLRKSGLKFNFIRAQTAAEMESALAHPEPLHVVLADYNLPEFSGPAALQALKAAKLDLPFIMLSGAVSEETAVAAMRAGAHDYVSKDNLTRLVPAIQRELKEAGTRSKRLAAERALHASEARFHYLVEAMPLGLLISNAAGKITYANLAALRLLHSPADALLSDDVSLTSICPALSDAWDALASTSLTTEPFESVCTTLDGTPIEVLIGIAFLNPDARSDERELAAFIADLTLQKRSEELLRRTEKLAVAGRFAASISHEINNPLEAITNCLYLIDHTEIPDDARSYLKMAQGELNRVSQITIQTLRFHNASTRPVRVDIADLVQTVLTLLESRLRHQKVEVTADLRHAPAIYAHDGEIRQVIANLVGNAIDAMPHGGHVTVRAALSYDWKDGSPGVVITVADNGTGMDPVTLSRVFEPFFSTKGITGTGLGLWVSSEIARKHQGHIRARSHQATSPDSRGYTIFRFFFRPQDEPSTAPTSYSLAETFHPLSPA